MFPGFRLSLPPKRWFKDNYDSNFLEDRQLGLQAFLQNLVAHKDIANWYVSLLCLIIKMLLGHILCRSVSLLQTNFAVTLSLCWLHQSYVENTCIAKKITDISVS